MEEECITVEKEQCKEEVEMECQTVEKQACTSIVEQVFRLFIVYILNILTKSVKSLNTDVQVCSIESSPVCREKETKSCDLVQDVLCRNITQTR